MSSTQVRVSVDGPDAAITFFTEEGLNVLAPGVLHAFGAAIARIKQDTRVRTTTIQAVGKVFLAGADAKAMPHFGTEEAREYGALGQGVFNDLAALPSVTVAAINGAALGGGLELALACDFRIAVKSAKLGLPEVTLGLIPGWSGIPRLTKLVGPSWAKRLYLSGMRIPAADGMKFGLVDEVVNSVEDLAPRVAAFCKSFRMAAPSAIALAKRASRDMDDLTAFADCFRTHECHEGVAAFLEKRPAKWTE